VQTHLTAVNCDLRQCEPVFKKYALRYEQSVQDRVSFRTVDFFKDELPSDVDALMFGNVIHDWDDDVKRMLIKKAYAALPKGGHIVIYDFYTDIEEGKPHRTDNFLMSVHMQMACTGSQFTSKEMCSMLAEVGFGNFQIHKIDLYNDVAIATKL